MQTKEAPYSCSERNPRLSFHIAPTDLDHWKQKACNGGQQGPQGMQGRAKQGADHQPQLSATLLADQAGSPQGRAHNANQRLQTCPAARQQSQCQGSRGKGSLGHAKRFIACCLVCASALVCSLCRHSWQMCCLVAQVPGSPDDLACILDGDCQLLEHDTLPKQKCQQDGETDLSMVLQPLKQGAGGQCANDALEDLHSGRRQSAGLACLQLSMRQILREAWDMRVHVAAGGQHMRWRSPARHCGQDW